MQGYSQNLVLNPSFEDTLSCPSVVTFPFLKSEHWIQPTGGSSDFFSVYTTCNTSGGGIPENVLGYQYPKTLESYLGFAVYASPPFMNSRE